MDAATNVTSSRFHVLRLRLLMSPAGAKIFDLFATWRLDSGDYSQVAQAVKTAWELRCSQFDDPAQAPKEPALMHSNLSSVQELEAAAR